MALVKRIANFQRTGIVAALFAIACVILWTVVPSPLSESTTAESGTRAAKSGTATSGKLFSGKPVRQSLTPLDPKIAQIQWEAVLEDGHQCDSKRPFAAVVTTIAQVSTKAISELASSRPDVTVIVIADKKSPQKWDLIHDNVKYVTVEEQERLYSGSFMPPWNHFGRKNVGYLQALKSGACFIWDFDDDNILLDPVHGVLQMDNLRTWAQTAVEVTAPSAFADGAVPSRWVNLMPIMGNTRFIWPRGSPLEPLQQASTFLPPLQAMATCKQQGLPAGCVPLGADCHCLGLLSTLAQGNPDLDAIQRLTGPSDIYFRREVGSLVALGIRTTMSHNAQATVVSRSALILGMLPMTVHGRVSDIWRAVTLNRLCEVYGLRVAVTSGTVQHIRNPHSFLGDLDAEQPLYAQANVLGNMLADWTPTRPSSVGGTIQELYILLYEAGVVEAQDVLFAQQWVLAAAAALKEGAERAGATRSLRSNGPLPHLVAPSRSLGGPAPQPAAPQAAAAVRVTAGDVDSIPSWLAAYAGVFSDVVFLLSGSMDCRVHSLPSWFNATVLCEAGSTGLVVQAGAEVAALDTAMWPGALAALHAVSTDTAWVLLDVNAAVRVGQLKKALQGAAAKQQVLVDLGGTSADGKLTKGGTPAVTGGAGQAQQAAAKALTAAAAASKPVADALKSCAQTTVPLSGHLLAIIPAKVLQSVVAVGSIMQQQGVPGDVAVAATLACRATYTHTESLWSAHRLLSATGLWQHLSAATE